MFPGSDIDGFWLWDNGTQQRSMSEYVGENS
jgi:hypothetical protein